MAAIASIGRFALFLAVAFLATILSILVIGLISPAIAVTGLITGTVFFDVTILVISLSTILYGLYYHEPGIYFTFVSGILIIFMLVELYIGFLFIPPPLAAIGYVYGLGLGIGGLSVTAVRIARKYWRSNYGISVSP